MNLIKKILQHKGGESSTLPISLDQKALYASTSSAGVSNEEAEAEKETAHGRTHFMDLPTEIHLEILAYLSYDDIAKSRRTCKLMNTLCSYLLNRGFQQLGIEIDKEKLRIKRELPRRESMRRSHRLSGLNDAYAGLDTRFSIMMMTYRKFIDVKATCFIPGKVLDEFFRILDILKKSHDRGGGILTVDIHELLKDLRDLSSMAMEHFEEHVQPSLRSTTSSPLSSSYFVPIHPLLHPSSAKTSSSTSEVCVDSCEWRKNFADKLARQDKIIEKQNSEIMSLKSSIRQLVMVCQQLTTTVPMMNKGINNLLNVILDSLLLHGSTASGEPSTSGNEMERLFSKERKRSYSPEDSHEYDVKKKPRRDDTVDDDHTSERLI
ncbi:hypothetical protein KIN20_018403 [Parelaphostrongylus tenuis]|uniref:F-box domain-containing protein n=1 Tax=Parelaphostrongylus tenuis TaxID=148309 RepID=A0AAD5N467_PARTN|nr:hypothetical protein KIN20_018403 [Parelaphostrongylus tenuis]